MSEEFEEIEQIPWAALAARTPDPRWRLALIAAAGCAVVVLLLVAGKVILSGGGDGDAPGEVPAIPSQQAVAAPPAEPPATHEREVVPATVETSPAAGTYSEADLMAISSDAEELLAMVSAKWFARDFLNGVDVAEQRGWLGIGAPADDIPTFVEFVDAYAVSAIGPAEYRVEVAYRLLVETGNGFVRQPAAALALELAIGGDGGVRVLYPPEIVEPPTAVAAELADLSDEIPPRVAEMVAGRAPAARVLGGFEQDAVWHVIVDGELAPGVLRPYRIVVAGE